MSLFSVTFRIRYDDDARYSSCYADIVAAIKGQTVSQYWDEPTSFCLIESAKTSAEIADAIVGATPDFDTDQDLVLVVNLSTTRGHAIRGTPHDPAYYAMMKKR